MVVSNEQNEYNNYNTRMEMKEVRRVRKHFPTTTSQPNKEVSCNFALKSMGQGWLEIHSADHLIDVISLPPSLRMAELYQCVDAETERMNPQVNSSTYMFSRGCQLWVGQPDDGNMGLICKQLPLHGAVMMTNGVRINNRVVNIATHQQNTCYVHSFHSDLQELQEPTHTHTQVPIGCTIAPKANLVQCSPLLYTVSTRQDDDQQPQSLVAFDLEKQALCMQLWLPSMRHSSSVKCLAVPKLPQQVMCCYSEEYLALIDGRSSTLINMVDIHKCESVMSLPYNHSYSLYYTQQNTGLQYDIRRAGTNRTPVLTHTEKIADWGELGGGLVRVEDKAGGGISLYSYR